MRVCGGFLAGFRGVLAGCAPVWADFGRVSHQFISLEPQRLRGFRRILFFWFPDGFYVFVSAVVSRLSRDCFGFVSLVSRLRSAIVSGLSRLRLGSVSGTRVRHWFASIFRIFCKQFGGRGREKVGNQGILNRWLLWFPVSQGFGFLKPSS